MASKTRTRTIVPTSGVEIAKAKSLSNVSRVVRTSENSEIYFNSRGRLVLRKVGRIGKLNEKAQGLKACKGQKGADFKDCAGLVKGGKKAKEKEKK